MLKIQRFLFGNNQDLAIPPGPLVVFISSPGCGSQCRYTQ